MHPSVVPWIQPVTRPTDTVGPELAGDHAKAHAAAVARSSSWTTSETQAVYRIRERCKTVRWCLAHPGALGGVRPAGLRSSQMPNGM